MIGKLKNEVRREAGVVALHLLVEASGGRAVERGKIGVEQDLLAAKHDDSALDTPRGHERRVLFRCAVVLHVGGYGH
jgi:hypothetical protein